VHLHKRMRRYVEYIKNIELAGTHCKRVGKGSKGNPRIYEGVEFGDLMRELALYLN
jgi:hypothetical protein